MFHGSGHNHRQCIRHIVAEAERHCAANGSLLTPQRRRVLEIVAASHQAIGAYEVLERMVDENGKRPAPMTVYRALDFLMEQGIVHKIESRNAFIACSCPEREHEGAQFLICEGCGEVAELNDGTLDRAIAKGASHVGFTVSSPVVEINGLCPNCR